LVLVVVLDLVLDLDSALVLVSVSPFVADGLGEAAFGSPLASAPVGEDSVGDGSIGNAADGDGRGVCSRTVPRSETRGDGASSMGPEQALTRATTAARAAKGIQRRRCDAMVFSPGVRN
jgi:hypothetical protein